MILRKKSLHDACPNKHKSSRSRQCEQVRRHQPQPFTPGDAAAPADQGAREHEAGLAGDQDRGDLYNAMRQQPSGEELAEARLNVVRRHGSKDDAVKEEERPANRFPK